MACLYDDTQFRGSPVRKVLRIMRINVYKQNTEGSGILNSILKKY